MFRIIVGLTMMLGGILLGAVSTRSYLKEANKLEGKDQFKGPLKFKHLFNVFTGLCIAILGIMAIFALLNDNIIELAAVTILLIDSTVEYRIDKKLGRTKKNKSDK